MLTLALACLGVLGVVSYGVAVRTKEMGIRVALGASRPRLVRAIVRQVLSPVAIGTLVGVLLAIPAGRALSAEPFYLQHVDPAAFVSALAVLTAAAAVGALWPAWTTVRSNPIEALRHQ
jgi:ABC-type antimicrobial peptide transport system permease subunit